MNAYLPAGYLLYQAQLERMYRNLPTRMFLFLSNGLMTLKFFTY